MMEGGGAGIDGRKEREEGHRRRQEDGEGSSGKCAGEMGNGEV